MTAHSIDRAVPFVANPPDGTHCLQACLRMIVDHFRPDLRPSLAELDRATGKVPGRGTWISRGALWLLDLGLDVRAAELFDYRRFAVEGEPYLLDFFGPEMGPAQVRETDIPVERRLAAQFATRVQPDVRLPTVADLRALIAQDFVVLCHVNLSALHGRRGYEGHAMLLKGLDDTHLIAHDPGPPAQADVRLADAHFDAAWSSPTPVARNLLAVRRRQR